MLLSPTVLLTQATVLVVNDEEPLLRNITRALDAAGYHVLTARDGSEALCQLRKSLLPVQLVITDVSMPGITGPELAAQITTEPYPPPVLLVSADHAFLGLPGPLFTKLFLLYYGHDGAQKHARGFASPGRKSQQEKQKRLDPVGSNRSAPRPVLRT